MRRRCGRCSDIHIELIKRGAFFSIQIMKNAKWWFAFAVLGLFSLAAEAQRQDLGPANSGLSLTSYPYAHPPDRLSGERLLDNTSFDAQYICCLDGQSGGFALRWGGALSQDAAIFSGHDPGPLHCRWVMGGY